jgi:transposase
LAPPSDDHECGWRGYAQQLQSDLDQIKAEIAELKRQKFGRKSEKAAKMPPIEHEVRRGKKADPEETLRKRRERALAKEKLVSESVKVPVPAKERCCPHCQRQDLRPVGEGKASTIYDYVPGFFRRRVVQRETLACPCGEYIVTAPSPEKSTDKTRYAPSFIAHLIVSKCSDCIPLYRLETQYNRIGVPIARSTMTDLFHRNAELLAPLAKHLLARVAGSEIVLADETPIRMQGTPKSAFLWTFLAGNDITYVFSTSRSGDTPTTVLGGTKGTLVVDAYTGYNKVTKVDGRKRAGCMAHARRKFFEALRGVPEAEIALSLIRDLYVVEHEARERDIVGTAEHLVLRQTRSRPILAELFRWLRQQRGRHLPKGPMGKAIGYALRNHRALTRFTCDPRLPPDNNRSEAALRIIALGRKNFLFVGNEDAGVNIAGLYSLVATCVANGKNPLEYLTDVLTRISSHPQSRIDELMPDRWQPVAA